MSACTRKNEQFSLHPKWRHQPLNTAAEECKCRVLFRYAYETVSALGCVELASILSALSSVELASDCTCSWLI
jgi:hypothetical protein